MFRTTYYKDDRYELLLDIIDGKWFIHFNLFAKFSKDVYLDVFEEVSKLPKPIYTAILDDKRERLAKLFLFEKSGLVLKTENMGDLEVMICQQ